MAALHIIVHRSVGKIFSVLNRRTGIWSTLSVTVHRTLDSFRAPTLAARCSGRLSGRVARRSPSRAGGRRELNHFRLMQ